MFSQPWGSRDKAAGEEKPDVRDVGWRDQIWPSLGKTECFTSLLSGERHSSIALFLIRKNKSILKTEVAGSQNKNPTEPTSRLL